MNTRKKIWSPSSQFIQNANLTKYNKWLYQKHGLAFDDYKSLWGWSVENPSNFWKSISDYFDVKYHSEPDKIMSDDPMPCTHWFEGSTLNYSEHIFRQKNDDYPAILFASEQQPATAIFWKELEQQTAALQAFLKRMNVETGDTVAAYIPNIPQATIAFLAVNSLGLIWSSCSPDFGSQSVLDRFRQIEPKIFIAVDGYSYNGKPYERTETVKEICKQLPSVEKVICIPYLNKNQKFKEIDNSVSWDEVMEEKSETLTFTPVPFSHPMWVLYSSGTTGAPKAITHSHGGMLLEHLKYLSLHNDVNSGENFFWFSTTGWMMWNFVQASLLVGATIVLYDGGAGYPDLEVLWKLTADLPIHHFGISAPFIIACMKAGLKPDRRFDLSALRSIGSTGSPLPPKGFDYIYEDVKSDVWLCSMSGGTDICTALVGGNPWKPVYEGEIQSRALGCSMYAYNESGKTLTDEVGEMVITKAMPCMPIYFWNDKDYERYQSSYFEMYPGVWRHGDWLKITGKGGAIILGRSDTTLNRKGVRIGTAEVYSGLNKIKEVKDSLIVNVELLGGGDYMPLFVVMQEGKKLLKEVKNKINLQMRNVCSPRHVPNEIIEVQEIPYTISGKKMEAPVKKILMGESVEKAASKGAMQNPESLKIYQEIAEEKMRK